MYEPHCWCGLAVIVLLSAYDLLPVGAKDALPKVPSAAWEWSARNPVLSLGGAALSAYLTWLHWH